jgi:hypothetical protein
MKLLKKAGQERSLRIIINKTTPARHCKVGSGSLRF